MVAECVCQVFHPNFGQVGASKHAHVFLVREVHHKLFILEISRFYTFLQIMFCVLLHWSQPPVLSS